MLFFIDVFCLLLIKFSVLFHFHEERKEQIEKAEEEERLRKEKEDKVKKEAEEAKEEIKTEDIETKQDDIQDNTAKVDKLLQVC